MSVIRAVVIGANQCENALPRNLRFAEADAKEFSKRLEKQSLYSVSEIKLFNDRTSVQVILDHVAACASVSTRDDCLLLYFAGHGISELDDKDEVSLYLACKSTDLNQVVSTSINLPLAVRLFENSLAGLAVIILDCCFSGHPGGRSLLGPHYLRRQQTGRPLKRVSFQTPNGTGRIVFSASGQYQLAVESSLLGHGVFTHALLETLYECRRQPSISIAQLYYLVQRSVLEQTKGRQCPSLYGGDHGAHLATF